MSLIPEYGSFYEWSGVDMAASHDFTVLAIAEQVSDMSWVVTVTREVNSP